MEPEAHRLDREVMLADRLAAAERVRREVAAVTAAAEEKRRAFLDRFIAEMRVDAAWRLERERIVAGLLDSAASGAAAAARRPAVAPAGRSEDPEREPLRLVRAAAG